MIRCKFLYLKYFEVDEQTVINELIRIIVHLCRTDAYFLKRLKMTKDRKIVNSDWQDKYFGGKHNVYGTCLMKVRDEKLYNSKLIDCSDMQYDEFKEYEEEINEEEEK